MGLSLALIYQTPTPSTTNVGQSYQSLTSHIGPILVLLVRSVPLSSQKLAQRMGFPLYLYTKHQPLSQPMWDNPNNLPLHTSVHRVTVKQFWRNLEILCALYSNTICYGANPGTPSASCTSLIPKASLKDGFFLALIYQAPTPSTTDVGGSWDNPKTLDVICSCNGLGILGRGKWRNGEEVTPRIFN